MVTYFLTIFKVKPSRQTVGLLDLIPVTKPKQLMPGNRTSYTYLNIITIIISYISKDHFVISLFFKIFSLTLQKQWVYKYQFSLQIIHSSSIKMKITGLGSRILLIFLKYVSGWEQLIRLSFATSVLLNVQTPTGPTWSQGDAMWGGSG